LSADCPFLILLSAIPHGLYSRFLHLFSTFDKTVVFCGGGLVTSFFFVKNGEYTKLGVVGLLMAVILSAWHYGDQMLSKGPK
jgi:MFS-type transporter involved in bile tolerance (Atg22 family)